MLNTFFWLLLPRRTDHVHVYPISTLLLMSHNALDRFLILSSLSCRGGRARCWPKCTAWPELHGALKTKQKLFVWSCWTCFKTFGLCGWFRIKSPYFLSFSTFNLPFLLCNSFYCQPDLPLSPHLNLLPYDIILSLVHDFRIIKCIDFNKATQISPLCEWEKETTELTGHTV